MSAVRKTVVGCALAAACAIALIIAFRGPATSRDDAPVAAPAAPVAVTAPTPAAPAQPPSAIAPRTNDGTPPAGAPGIEDVMRARTDGSPEGMAVLLAGIESTDAVVVAESTNALVAHGAIWTLPALIEQDVLARPYAAPSIIDALGRIGALAPPEQRGEVVDRLVALMRTEKTRGSQESLGNLIQIYEALGHTGDPRAIEPLEHELVDRTVPTAPKVVIVQSLVALRATRSLSVLQRLGAELSAPSTATGFEAELQRDLLGAIRDALVKLS
jgi:hypothetical protein